MSKLRLRAESQADLEIIAAAVQDAILRVGEINYDLRGRSLTLRMTRFQHETDKAARAQSGLRFDSVLGVRTRGIDRSDPEACLLYTSPSPRDATLSRMPSSA